MLPELYDMFDNLFDEVDVSPRNMTRAMSCDVEEHDHDYELNMSMPGANKDNVRVSLNDGYLNISYHDDRNNDETDANGNLIRQERFHGSMSRSFYVGDSMKKEDIKARFDNGELHITVPKTENAIENNDSYIAIE